MELVKDSKKSKFAPKTKILDIGSFKSTYIKRNKQGGQAKSLK